MQPNGWITIDADDVVTLISPAIGDGTGRHDLDPLMLAEEMDAGASDRDRAVRLVGEPGLPPVGPAIPNAVAVMTGVRLRRYPFHSERFNDAWKAAL